MHAPRNISGQCSLGADGAHEAVINNIEGVDVRQLRLAQLLENRNKGRGRVNESQGLARHGRVGRRNKSGMGAISVREPRVRNNHRYRPDRP